MSELPEFEVDVQKMRLSDIHTADYNPRKKVHDIPEFYEYLYNSVLSLGYINPIIVNIKDGKNIIVGGNQRYAVICDMTEDAGKKKEDVLVSVIAVNMEEAEEMAANIALNKIHGDWIQDKLKEDLEFIKNIDEDLAKLAGFSDEDLNNMLEEIIDDEKTVPKDFKIHINLPPEYENYYDFFISVNGEDALKKEVMKLIMGANDGKKSSKK
jgi:ParB-like chromosome segregation protein Spo0J